MKPQRLLPVLAIATLASGCAIFQAPAGPPPLQAPPATPLPAAELRLVARAPEGTPGDAQIEVEMLDPITGFGPAAAVFPMQADGAGQWSARLTPPAGSLIYFRFVRTNPQRAVEANLRGEPVVTRLALVDGPGEIREVIAAWSDSPPSGAAGRIVGTLFDAATGQALPDIVVGAGGRFAFSDGQGAFRLDDLPAGLHSLVAVSPSGAYRSFQQGAVVASDSETPAVLGLIAAQPVVVTFQVTVPSDTPPDAPLRLAGNLLSLGNSFSGLAGGPSGSVGRMPELVRIDPTTFLGVVGLYAGADLSYRYTLGDGIWNTERDATGNVLTRQTILGDSDATFSDVVATWHTASTPGVTFMARSVAGMPPTDGLSLQLRGPDWLEPIPMWPVGPGEWGYTLFGPLLAGTPLNYRYCRNQQCGAADDLATPGADPAGRQVVPSGDQVAVSDDIDAWAWWQSEQPGAVVVAPEIRQRPEFEVGYEIAPDFSPSWLSRLQASFEGIRASGATSLLLTPAWVLRENEPIPQIVFDPQRGPLLEDLERQVGQARDLGLRVGLHPTLIGPGGDASAWWSQARRDNAWWTVFFERYRAFILTYAGAAQRSGAEKLVLGGPDLAPALPGGLLADGTPSGAPSDAEARWRSLIDEVRGIYTGTLAFEIDFGRSLQPVPPFLDAVDQIHVYWHVPLGEGNSLPSAEMQAAAFAALDGSLLAEPSLQGRSILLSVEYLSIDGGATACAPLPDGSCRAPASFDAGADPDPDLAIDLAEQSDAMNAVILAAYGRETIHGFYARRYYPPVALHDKSASVNGKPAGQMLGYWYPRISGQ